MRNRRFVLYIVAVCVIVFIVQNLTNITDIFVLSDVAARPFTLVTSMFLHGSVYHLLSNMFALFVFGLILEHNIGTKKFVLLYFSSGIVAGAVGSLMYSSLLGASGAIFGVLGFLAAIKPRLVVWTYGVPMPMAVAALFWLLLDVAGVFYPGNVANMAHIAGLVFGVVLGLYSAGNEPKERKKERSSLISDKQFQHWEDQWM